MSWTSVAMSAEYQASPARSLDIGYGLLRRVCFEFIVAYMPAGRGECLEAAADAATPLWLVGSAPAPARDVSVPVYVSGDRLYQVESDDLGVQYVAVYRIRPSSPL